MKNIKSCVLSVVTIAMMSSSIFKADLAQAASEKVVNHFVSNSEAVNSKINEDIKLQFLSRSVFKKKIEEKKFKSLSPGMIPISSSKAMRMIEQLPSASEVAKTDAVEEASVEDDSLLVGLPIGLLGEQNIFGGVITKVTDKQNETLGTLKLTDLAPLNVRTLIARFEDGTPAVALYGCANACDENSQQQALGINFPVMGIDEENNLLIIDLAAIGKELDLISMMDAKGDYTKLKSISSATTSLDYSYSTLIFDIKTKMIPLASDVNDPTAPVTELTVRWYLKLNSTFNPTFTPRSARSEVGFFETSRSKENKITRFSTTNNGKKIHYYIKNVPTEFRAHFENAIKNWNKELTGIVGRDLLTYEFLETTDARHAQMVAGDIRYNVIEWDLDNKAGYGGLGPSIANQVTGEILSANVLIQGPTIVEMYSKWFALSKVIRDLKSNGKIAEAKILEKNFNVEAQSLVGSRNKQKFSIKLGALEMNVRAQTEALEDPIIKGSFEIIPEGVTYETYMEGYFKEMLQHELGHNLGLRHNFKGNLGAKDDGTRGSVSRSIMEYLGRSYRHLNDIGDYDRMAISYGYKGIAPTQKNWYCTDEHEGPIKNEKGEIDLIKTMLTSPECSKLDATSDPFSFWEGRLARSIDLMVEKKSPAAPVWNLKEITPQVDELVIGFSLYGMTVTPSTSWTNFAKEGRPVARADVRTYIIQSLKKQLCDPALQDVIMSKETPEAQKLATDNLNALRNDIALKVGIFTLPGKDLDCSI